MTALLTPDPLPPNLPDALDAQAAELEERARWLREAAAELRTPDLHAAGYAVGWDDQEGVRLGLDYGVHATYPAAVRAADLAAEAWPSMATHIYALVEVPR